MPRYRYSYCHFLRVIARFRTTAPDRRKEELICLPPVRTVKSNPEKGRL
jgi:hypothetical protein